MDESACCGCCGFWLAAFGAAGRSWRADGCGFGFGIGLGFAASGSPDGRTARRGRARRCSVPGLGAVDLAAWREATVAGDGAGADAGVCCGEGPGVLFIKLSVVSRNSRRGTGRAA